MCHCRCRYLCVLNFDVPLVSVWRKTANMESTIFANEQVIRVPNFQFRSTRTLRTSVCRAVDSMCTQPRRKKKRTRQINEFGSVGLCKRSRHNATVRCNWIWVWIGTTLQIERRTKTRVLWSVMTSSSARKICARWFTNIWHFMIFHDFTVHTHRCEFIHLSGR